MVLDGPMNGEALAIEAFRATLRYLPRYSPNFDPIKMAFAKLKALLRAAARTIPDPLAGQSRPTPPLLAATIRKLSYRRRIR